jgi:outer membrane protein OmpA-like peptidoglycan-associated protein
MSVRAITVGVAALVWAGPATAQRRGTIEFGAFGSAASFDNDLSLRTGYGGGGRIGMYLHPRWSVEFEMAEMRANRPAGLRNVNVGILAGRLMASPIKAGPISFLVGGGAGVSTETNFMHSYGVDALAGAKLALGSNVALRVDGVWDWLANEDWKSYKSVRAGFSLYRHSSRMTRMTMAPPAAPMLMARDDSVSAAETRRLRDSDLALRALRDSLSNAPARTMAMPSAATLSTMETQIHFAFDKSELSDSAKALLDEKVALFRDNPAATVVLLGYTDAAGTDAYNMALGARRAQAAKDYLVGRGIAESRVIMESKGERQQLSDGAAPNRRAIFRLLIAPDATSRD